MKPCHVIAAPCIFLGPAETAAMAKACGAAEPKVEAEAEAAALAKGRGTSNPTSNHDPGLGYLGLGRAGDAGALATCPVLPSTLWNSMLAPLTVLAPQGWLWYQVRFMHAPVSHPALSPPPPY